jgi:hypothetical protein
VFVVVGSVSAVGVEGDVTEVDVAEGCGDADVVLDGKEGPAGEQAVRNKPHMAANE